MALQYLAGPVIAAGEALSSALDCSAGTVIQLFMPADWTAANLTFQISGDGVAYRDFFTVDGVEVLIPVVAGSTIVLSSGVSDLSQARLPPFTGAKWLKLRSGPRARPVAQIAQRDFAVMLAIP